MKILVKKLHTRDTTANQRYAISYRV